MLTANAPAHERAIDCLDSSIGHDDTDSGLRREPLCLPLPLLNRHIVPDQLLQRRRDPFDGCLYAVFRSVGDKVQGRTEALALDAACAKTGRFSRANKVNCSRIASETSVVLV